MKQQFQAFKNLILLTLPSIFVCFILGELFFRFILPGAQMPWGYYDPMDRIARFDLGQGTGVYTIGKFAQQRGHWRINNMGWNSDIDYTAASARSKPLIAILGDSYIEALQVNTTDSLVSLLREKVGGEYDVYGFGRSGAPLSQYLQMSRYVNKHFDPAVIVINVVDNDFDESLVGTSNIPYFLGIDIKECQPRESALSLSPVHAKATTKILFSSSILRYLWFNLNFSGPLTRLGLIQDENRAAPKKQTTGTQNPRQEEDRSDINKAIEYIVGKLKEENPRRELIFMIDAPRRDIYAGTVRQSRVLWMNRLLQKMCALYSCRFIDLTEPFVAKFQRDGIRFSSNIDYHWNEEGHRCAAEVLYKNLVAFGIVH